jgi:hypothetical protein
MKSPRVGERNLEIKNYISEIIYSPEEIQIRLNYSGSSDDSRRNLKNEFTQDGNLFYGVGSRAAAGIGVDRFHSDISKNKSLSARRGWGGQNFANLLITLSNKVHRNRQLLKIG